MGKGDTRRPTDEKKVRKNWPFKKPKPLRDEQFSGCIYIDKDGMPKRGR